MSYQMYKKFFTDADTDGNGYLTLEELTAMLRRNGYKGKDDQIRTMFNSVDFSGDSMISLEEFLEAMGAVPEQDHRTASMRSCFRAFDKNGDGRIDRNELDQVFREMGTILTPRELDRLIQMGDKDGSGALDYEEFIAEVFGA